MPEFHAAAPLPKPAPKDTPLVFRGCSLLPKPVPAPKWVEVPTELNYEEAKDRFFVRFSFFLSPIHFGKLTVLVWIDARRAQIREFTVRFASLMHRLSAKYIEEQIGRAHV